MPIKVIFIVLVCCTQSLFAQSIEQKLKSAVDAHKAFNLDKAEKELELILRNPEKLNDNQLGEATYFYALTLAKRCKSKASSTPEKLVSIAEQQVFYKTYDSFIALQKMDNQRWSSKSEPELQNLEQSVLVASLYALTAITQSPENDIRLIKEICIGYISLANTIAPFDYVPYELWGQYYFLEGNIKQSANYFDKCLFYYMDYHHSALDNIRIPDVMLKRARIMRAESPANNDTTFKMLGWAQAALFAEMSLIAESKDYENPAKENAAKIYDQLSERINQQEAEWLAETDFTDSEKKERFDKLLEANPENAFIAYFYGIWLSKSDLNEAKKLLMKAVKTNPDVFEFQYYLGETLINQAKLILSGISDLEAGDPAEKLKVVRMYSNAYDSFKQAHFLQPNDVYTLRWLIDISQYLGKTEERAQWQKELSILGR